MTTKRTTYGAGKVRVGVQLEPEMYDWLRQYSFDRHMSMSLLITIAMEQFREKLRSSIV